MCVYACMCIYIYIYICIEAVFELPQRNSGHMAGKFSDKRTHILNEDKPVYLYLLSRHRHYIMYKHKLIHITQDVDT